VIKVMLASLGTVLLGLQDLQEGLVKGGRKENLAALVQQVHQDLLV
jgi:hypothetical protein